MWYSIFIHGSSVVTIPAVKAHRKMVIDFKGLLGRNRVCANENKAWCLTLFVGFCFLMIYGYSACLIAICWSFQLRFSCSSFHLPPKRISFASLCICGCWSSCCGSCCNGCCFANDVFLVLFVCSFGCAWTIGMRGANLARDPPIFWVIWRI